MATGGQVSFVGAILTSIKDDLTAQQVAEIEQEIIRQLRAEIEIPVNDWVSVVLPSHMKLNYRIEFRMIKDREFTFRFVRPPSHS